MLSWDLEFSNEGQDLYFFLSKRKLGLDVAANGKCCGNPNGDHEKNHVKAVCAEDSQDRMTSRRLSFELSTECQEAANFGERDLGRGPAAQTIPA